MWEDPLVFVKICVDFSASISLVKRYLKIIIKGASCSLAEMWFGFNRNHSDGMRYDFTDFGCTVSIGGEKQNSCDMRYFVLIFAEREKKNCLHFVLPYLNYIRFFSVYIITLARVQIRNEFDFRSA